MTLPNSGNNLGPGLAVIMSLEYIWVTVVYLIAISRQIQGARLMSGLVNDTNSGKFWKVSGGNILPRRTSISGNVHLAVIRSGPDGIDVVK